MSDQILVAEGLCKSFAGFIAVDNVSLSVERGTIHALIGPNGAGKTTCFNLITRFLTPTSGTIRLDGQDITGLGSDAIARLGMGRSFQISAVFNTLSAEQNVMLALQRRRGESYDFWGSIRRLDRNRDAAREYLDAVGIADLAHVPAGDLSYGRRRALEIATTLALDPRIILLDEPTAGMGAEDVERVTTLIRNAAKGRTVLMVEHNLGVVSKICDRVTVLARGAVLAEGTYAEIAANERVVEAYLGGAHA